MNWKGKIERMDSLRWIVHFLELTRKCVQIIMKKNSTQQDEVLTIRAKNIEMEGLHEYIKAGNGKLLRNSKNSTGY